MLEAAQAATIVDVGRLAPNAELQPAPRSGFSNFTIRGIGLDGSVRSIDPAVNLIVDGPVIGFPVANILDTFDVESIEVLRGPQGILFGRNTTGGAVSLRTRRPGNEFNVEGNVTFGNHSRFDVSALVEGPLIPDRLFAKLAVLHREHDGYFPDNNSGIFVPAPAMLPPTRVVRTRRRPSTRSPRIIGRFARRSCGSLPTTSS